ncbi:uncharacterized protein PV09_02629 [Verruconis gallopava]|uniref:Phosphatidylethanolamine-binding protein n=1 Tax=Verruconis gallopava TaxID=253628 RepID=A0A0D2AK86_9PEZI|nr:uncharacterized protein PV09_02629 [Verruconis gallopava]KIW06970.1 hypothetical protein PV09_02629 [Verruconis gallopava]
MKAFPCYHLLASLAVASAQTFPGFTVTITNKLGVTYGDISVSNGQQLPRADVLSPPNISSSDHFSATGKAVLIMMDSDVPANSTSRTTLLHWLVPDITGVTDGTNSTYLTLPPSNDGVPYQPPSPPQGDYPHRYSFLLYEQTRDFSIPSTVNASSRRGFDLKGFLNDTGLVTSLAANYMLVANVSGPASTSFPPALYTASSTLASSEAAATATSSGSSGSSGSSASTTSSSASGTAATTNLSNTGEAQALRAGSGVALLAAIFGVILI